MLNLTMSELRMMYESVRRVFYVHPEDLNQQFVKELKERGYEIVSRESMVVGKGFLQNAMYCGIVDFGEQKVYITKNPLSEMFAGERGLPDFGPAADW